MNNFVELIHKGETESLEFKESLRLKEELGQAISAFSNANGGSILIGISDAGTCIGVEIGRNTLEELANYIKRNTDPAIFPSMKTEQIENKEIVVIEVKVGSEKPVFFRNHAYKRVGKTNQRISSSEIRKLAKESGERIYWDEQVCEGVNFGDINERKVKWFLKDARKQRGLNLSEDAPIEEALMKLKLLRNGKLTNAALLLFFKEPMVLQSEVKCIRFSGNEPIKPYTDFQTIEGTVFDLVDKAEDFVLRNIRKSIRLVPGKVQREEKYEYPPDAIREAVVNAVAHRDYESPSKVQVRIFDDRIEIWSPGTLPDVITIEDLRREHVSVPRNPLLFKQLFWVKYVEDVGGGTLDMISQCRDWGIPEPVFEHISGAFVVTFRLPPTVGDLERLGLNERQIKAMDYIVKKGSISNKEYTSLNSISRKTATIDLTQLVTKGLLIRVGEGKRDIRYILPNYAKITQRITQNRDESF
ncbi:ATP-dependent DNA helicase RecG [Candidatus Methanophagaceae archaeon]|jgi:ATP-dependent DNA helicase RecG|nr:ATP-dependent DNA helicase RecG [Methanophagales archaeon]